MCTFSMLHLSGMTSIQRYPFTAAAMARAVPVQREEGDTEHIHSGTSVHHHPIHSSHPSPPHKHTHSQAHRKKGRRYRTQAQKVSNWVCEPDYKELGVTSSSGQRRGPSSQSEPGSTSTITSELKPFSTLLPLEIPASCLQLPHDTHQCFQRLALQWCHQVSESHLSLPLQSSSLQYDP